MANKEGIKKCICFTCPRVRVCPIGEQVVAVKGEIIVSVCKYRTKR